MTGRHHDHPPAGLSTFDRTTEAHTLVDVPAERVGQVLRDLRRLADWLTMHSGWRGTPPGGAAVGVRFDEQVLLMGIPADISWVVEEVSDSRVALVGRGPMDLTLGLWLSFVDHGEGASVRIDAGVSGDPV
jgi:acetyl-CoA C-acetyltransferase